MITVTLVGFEHALSTSICGIIDIFSMVGVTWNRIHHLPEAPQFDIKIASKDGQSFNCLNGVKLNAHCSLDAIDRSDLIFVPTIGGHVERTIEENAFLLEWLNTHHNQGAAIASNCTGAFLLGASGLLDHKIATTHWAYADYFRKKFPLVKLKPELLITNDGQIFCSGGGLAWMDLGLYLVERYCGRETAQGTSKAVVMHNARSTQLSYSTITGKRYHHDSEILAVQDWLDDHFNEHINLDNMAKVFNFTPRTFKRRFKEAVGESPLSYLQCLRVEAAKKLLESGTQSIESVTQAVGYEDVSSFNKLFKKKTGVTPGNYRSKFGHIKLVH